MNGEVAGKAPERILCVQEGGQAADSLRPLLPDVEFHTARIGAHALSLARDGLFGLYIVADELEDMPGPALCRQIREFDPHTPIFLCCHGAAAAARFALADIAVQGVITNPVDGLVVPQLIRTSLTLARLRSIEAEAAELEAVCDEIAEHLREAERKLGRARRALLLAHDAGIMSRAYLAFADAGGRRADFNRMWPDVYQSALAKTR